MGRVRGENEPKNSIDIVNNFFSHKHCSYHTYYSRVQRMKIFRILKHKLLMRTSLVYRTMQDEIWHAMWLNLMGNFIPKADTPLVVTWDKYIGDLPLSREK